jgi:hypothetical protein
MRTGQEREMREKIIDTAIEEFTRKWFEIYDE